MDSIFPGEKAKSLQVKKDDKKLIPTYLIRDKLTALYSPEGEFWEEAIDRKFLFTKQTDEPFLKKSGFQVFPLKPTVLIQLLRKGFTNVTSIQEQIFPLMLTSFRRSLMVQSQSGSGKTFAYVCSAVTKIDNTLEYPQVIILVPTPELATRIRSVIDKVFIKTDLTKVKVLINDSYKCLTDHIIISVLDNNFFKLWESKVFNSKLLTMVIVDEADLLVEKYPKKLEEFLGSLDHKCKKIFLTTTLTKKLHRFIKQIAFDCFEIEIPAENLFLSNIKQTYYNCKEEDKMYFVNNCCKLLTDNSMLVFVNHKSVAFTLFCLLRKKYSKTILVTDDNDVDDRVMAYAQFRKIKKGIAICTDEWSRGLDFRTVDLIIHFDLPINKNAFSVETYVHRIGRASRMGKAGLSIALINSASEKQFLNYITTTYNVNILELSDSYTEDIRKILHK